MTTLAILTERHSRQPNDHYSDRSEFSLNRYYGDWNCTIIGRHNGVKLEVSSDGQPTAEAAYEQAWDRYCAVSNHGMPKLEAPKPPVEEASKPLTRLGDDEIPF